MNLNTEINIDFKKSIAWFESEVIDALPERFKKYIADVTGNIFITSSAGNYILEFVPIVGGLNPVTLPLIPGETDFAQLINQYPFFARARIILQLDAGETLIRHFMLPAAVKDNVDEVIRYEIDRLTPFSIQDIYYHVQALGKINDSQYEYQIQLTRQTTLNEHLDTLRLMGMRPHVVLAGSDIAKTAFYFRCNLLPEALRPGKTKLDQVFDWGVNSLILVLLGFVLFWPLWQENNDNERLNQQLRALDQQTSAILSTQEEVQTTLTTLKDLFAVKHQSPSLLVVLNELTRLLKDDTWIQHVQYADQQLQILGQSPSATKLISLLEASKYFENVAFLSPVTSDKSSGIDRFEIGMNISTNFDMAAEDPDAAANSEETPEAAPQEEVPAEAETPTNEEVPEETLAPENEPAVNDEQSEAVDAEQPVEEPVTETTDDPAADSQTPDQDVKP